MNETQCRLLVNTRAGSWGGDRPRCERCGQTGTTIHHRLKRSQGGRWTPSNCVALCGDGTRGCHGWTEMDPTAATTEGFLIPSYGPDPLHVPFVVHSLGMTVWTDDDGMYLLDPPTPSPEETTR